MRDYLIMWVTPRTAESLECLQVIKTVGSSLKNDLTIIAFLIPWPRLLKEMEQFPSSSPFTSFKISDQEPLRRAEAGSRSTCTTCKRRVKYFCYRCVRMVGELGEDGMIPEVSLPINMKM